MQQNDSRVLVREARLRDVSSIMRILNDDILNGENTLDTRVWTKTQGVMWFMRHDPETYPIYVAELDGKVVGYAAVNPYRSALGFERIAETRFTSTRPSAAAAWRRSWSPASSTRQESAATAS